MTVGFQDAAGPCARHAAAAQGDAALLEEQVELLTTQWLLFDGESVQAQARVGLRRPDDAQGEFYDAVETAIADLEALSVELQPAPEDDAAKRSRRPQCRKRRRSTEHAPDQVPDLDPYKHMRTAMYSAYYVDHRMDALREQAGWDLADARTLALHDRSSNGSTSSSFRRSWATRKFVIAFDTVREVRRPGKQHSPASMTDAAGPAWSRKATW
jgi:predicted nucleic acid-binding protein